MTNAYILRVICDINAIIDNFLFLSTDVTLPDVMSALGLATEFYIIVEFSGSNKLIQFVVVSFI